MGMSLIQHAFYGWDIGEEENLELPDGFDYWDFSKDKLKILKIETSNYYDFSRFFAVIENKSAYDGVPISESQLIEISKKFDLEKAKEMAEDILLINETFGVELKGLPQWWYVPQYF